ncbi:MAG: NmrA family NAD(P)-binding protein [Gemmatimonadaceae bacterium]
MSTNSLSVLVIGASGMLGGAVARRLIASGHHVRAMARDRGRLQPLADAGAEVFAADMRDPAASRDACAGVAQIFSTANNVHGGGANSPLRVDLEGYRRMAEAARESGVARWVHTSARAATPDSVVDFFRLKHEVDLVVRGSGVPYVLLRPAAFMDIWIDILLAPGIVKSGTATIFGSGARITNYIAVDDAADFAVAVLSRREILNEDVEFGGPSNVSMSTLADLLGAAMGKRVKKRHLPAALLRHGPRLLRPFNEVAARMMSLGYFTTVADTPLEDWHAPAARFGVHPRTAEVYIAQRFGSAARSN